MKIPYRVTLIITDACNFQCVGCLREFNKANHLDFELIARVAAQAKELGFTHFAITGGEPFLHPRFHDIVDLLTQHFSINIVTNGYIPSKYTFLADPKYVVRGRKPVITVSLDGATADVHDRSRRTGSFVRAIESIKLYQSLGLPVLVQSILSKITAPTAPALIQLVKELGLNRIVYLNTLRTQHNHEILLTPQELALTKTHIVTSKVPGVKVVFGTSAATPRQGPATSKAYLCERIQKWDRLDPTITPLGNWEWCCDLVQDGGTALGTVADMSLTTIMQVMQSEAITIHERRLSEVHSEQHPNFWTCEYCNSRYNANVKQEGTAPIKYIIPLTVKK